MSEARGRKRKPVTPAMEDYLEAIFRLREDKGFARVKDIAREMGVKMPSVTSMLKGLRERGLVDHGPYEYVELTAAGAKIGRETHRRHELLRQFLTDILQIEPGIADEDACKLEHACSAVTLETLTDFMDFIQHCPRAGDDWLKHFADYRRLTPEARPCTREPGQQFCHFRDGTKFDQAP